MHVIAAFSSPVAAVQQVQLTSIVRFLTTGAVVFTIAILACIVLTAAIRQLAPRVGLVDRPDNHRKLHNTAVPLGGGLAVYLSSALVLCGLLLLPNPWRDYLRFHQTEILVLLSAGAVIVVVGLLDDRFRLRGRLKLLGQVAAASVLIANGVEIQSIGVFGSERVYDLGPLAIPFTLFWLLGAVNSVNLLDGIDGLATVVGFILVATIAAMGITIGHTEVMIVALVFAGSLLGFLRFNFPPASIFLGDAGSMLIGLVVGTLAISGSLKAPGTVLLAAPLAVWTIPILDSAAAILRRKLTGRSIYTTDRGHLHHRLLDLFGSNRKVLALMATACTLTCGAALVSVFLKSDLVALLVCSSIVIILVATGIFGRAELNLVTNRFRKFSRSLLEPADGSGVKVRQSAVRLQGSRPWELLLSTLTESAEHLGLSEIRLDVNLPRAQEGYHAFWEYRQTTDLPPSWRVEIPLVAAGQPVGYLTVAGPQHAESACDTLSALLTVLEPFERKLRALIVSEVPARVVHGERDSAPVPSLSARSVTRRHPK